MDLKRIALLAEVLGGIGIIVSILYLALEVSENSKNTKISNQLALMQLNADVRVLVTSNAEAADMISRGSNEIKDLTGVERDRFYLFTQHLFDLWETAVMLRSEEALDDDVGALWSSGFCAYMDRPGYREIWSRDVHQNAIGKFRETVDACFSE